MAEPIRQIDVQPVDMDLAPNELGEGPVWLEDRAELAWVDIQRGFIDLLHVATGQVRTIPVGEMIGSIAPTRSGRLVAAVSTGFVLVDPRFGCRPPARDPRTRRPDDPDERRQGRSLGPLLGGHDGPRQAAWRGDPLLPPAGPGRDRNGRSGDDLERARLVGRSADDVLRRHAHPAGRPVRSRRRRPRAHRAPAVRVDSPRGWGSRRPDARLRRRPVAGALGRQPDRRVSAQWASWRRRSGYRRTT